MKTLLIIGAVVMFGIGVPAFGYLIRKIIRRPLTPEQERQEELLLERRRDARYFWR